MGNDAVEDIKAKLNVEDVVADYVELKRAGRNLKALSPFSNEKTASLMVSPEKQIWHDFSSGKGGNMFSFVMEMEGVDFKGALEILAKKAGIELSDYRSGQSAERGKAKSKMSDCLELAAKFYQAHFAKNKTALEYVFKKRGYTKQTALDFRLGYSPDSGRALIEFLNKKGFKEDDIKKAGLAASRYNRPVDMFRGRLMVPLQDARGQVIGFTARLLKDEPNSPKYINTPQTLLYDKSRHVYGLHLAKDAIRKEKFVVAVEGNLDVIASHQAGVKNVVASAGTAMTEMHIKELQRFTNDIRLAFDQDAAGLNAMERIIPIASKLGASLSIITVPEGKDPDELIQKDPKLWTKSIGDRQYALDWLIDMYSGKLDINTGVGKREFSDVILPVVARLTDQVEQDHYIGVLAEKIGISKSALREKTSKQKTSDQPKRKKPAQPQKVSAQLADMTKTQNQLLALCLVRKNLRSNLRPINTAMLSGDDAQKLLRVFQKNPEFGINDKPPLTDLKEVADYCKMLLVLYEEIYADLEENELEYEAARLQVRVCENYVKVQKAILVSKMQNANEAETEDLLIEVKKLDVLLKSVKESASAKS